MAAASARARERRASRDRHGESLPASDLQPARQRGVALPVGRRVRLDRRPVRPDAGLRVGTDVRARLGRFALRLCLASEPTRRRERHAVRDGERRGRSTGWRRRSTIPRRRAPRSCALAIAGASFNEGWHDLAIWETPSVAIREHACVADGGRAVRAADRSTADRRHHATRHAAGDGDPHVDVTARRLLEQCRRAVDEHARHPDPRRIDRRDVLLPRHQGRHGDASPRARPAGPAPRRS